MGRLEAWFSQRITAIERAQEDTAAAADAAQAAAAQAAAQPPPPPPPAAGPSQAEIEVRISKAENRFQDALAKVVDEVKVDIRRIESESAQTRGHCIEMTTSQVRDAIKHADSQDLTTKDKLQTISAKVERLESFLTRDRSADALLSSVFAAAERRGRGL